MYYFCVCVLRYFVFISDWFPRISNDLHICGVGKDGSITFHSRILHNILCADADYREATRGKNCFLNILFWVIVEVIRVDECC